MAKLQHDKYYTEESLAQYCIEKTFEIIGDTWERIIEPSVGEGSFMKFLPSSTISIDQFPSEKYVPTYTMDFPEYKGEYISHSLVIGNPPFG